jgi:hypothetical protein
MNRAFEFLSPNNSCERSECWSSYELIYTNPNQMKIACAHRFLTTLQGRLISCSLASDSFVAVNEIALQPEYLITPSLRRP